MLPIILLAIVVFCRGVIEFRHIGQSIFEGYVGRQVPTAMVARDLSRDGSFLYPRLQTGPFPSYFLIEPPVYAQAVAWLRQSTDVPLDACGRLVSLMSLAIGAIALWGLVRRRFGRTSACWSAAFFLSWPVTLRYGRAFQPDAFALAAFLAGAWFTAIARSKADEVVEDHIFPTLAWLCIAVSLATKITLAPLLIGLVLAERNARSRKKALFLISTLLPAICWYVWAGWLMVESKNQAGGQSTDGFLHWLALPGPLSLLSVDRWKAIAANVGWKAWTPLGLGFLAALPLILRSESTARRWALALAAWFLVVGGKAHHGYYWLVPSPFIAAVAGVCVHRASHFGGFRIGGISKAVFGMLMIITSFFMAADTYETPRQWQPLGQDLAPFRAWLDTRPDMTFVAHEAAVYAMDRPGLRWEWSKDAQRRAASAWGETLAGESPAALLEFCSKQGAAWFLAIETDPEWIRDSPGLAVILDRCRIVHRSGGLVLYSLTETEEPAKRP